jgi:hypothetical protein
MQYLQRIREFLNQAFIRLEAGFSIKTSSTDTTANDNNPSTPSTNAFSGNASGHGGSSKKSDPNLNHGYMPMYGGISPVPYCSGTPVVTPVRDITNNLTQRETTTEEEGTSYPN